ncbi:olfactory receptor class A-like protein 4 [Spea bombifrons]|uniref:olfactory receptor class A-like protein 4 n=1 Tax=Spea bombifrons TaxID=233779 RepID=UPI00234BF9B5|nr:olfactory receptor class A-like protein 4 [Spea bombifrons]
MKLSASIIEIIACCILIFVSIVGNAILIHCTWRCIRRRLPTSFTLIFSLAIVHLLKNLVVNTINIISSAGISTNATYCKIGLFTSSLTTTLEIWFTLYMAVFYCVKLNRVVHPRRTPPNGKWRKHHVIGVIALWITGIAVSCPYLIFGESLENQSLLNSSLCIQHGFLYDQCSFAFGDPQVELYYHKIFMVIIDLFPLLILVMVSCRTLLLFREQKKATYGNIWIGHDASETEVLRASKIIIFLTLLITSLWVSHFVLVSFLKIAMSWYLTPTILILLCSVYSSLSPYLLMLINYKISLKIRALSSFCCANAKKPTLSDGEKSSVPVESVAED